MVTNVRCMVKRTFISATSGWILCIATIAATTELSGAGADLGDWMSPEQLRAMGLDTLSASQQQQLADWIQSQVASASAGGVEAKNGVAARGSSPKAPSVIEAHIVGDV